MTDKKLTFYENISSLTAAHSLFIGKDTKVARKYWELDPSSRIIMDSEEEYINKFREIFTEAVDCRLRSAFPIGFELSGGLDSSSIVCTARNILKNKKSIRPTINTYSMIFDDIPTVDESYYIKKVVENGGINSNFILSDKISPLKDIRSVLRNQDQPFLTINIAILCNMYKKMKKDNIRIIIGGGGGDEIISYGKNYLRDLAVNMKWMKLINEINAFSKHTNHKSYDLFFNLVLIPLIPTQIKKILNKLLSLRKNNKEEFILNKKFTKKIGGKDYLDRFKFNSIMDDAKTARKYHYFMINRFSHQSTLEMLDRIAGVNSIEPRHPFFDKRLVEFCYAIPNDMKFKSGWVRYIHRISMENILPKELQWRRSKKYFDPVLKKNLLLYEENMLNKIFSIDNSLLKNYVDLDIINNIYQIYKSDHKIQNLNYLWYAIVLYLWLDDKKILFKKKDI